MYHHVIWLVVEPPLWKIWVKIGNLPQLGVKIKNIWNHHPVFLLIQKIIDKYQFNDPYSMCITNRLTSNDKTEVDISCECSRLANMLQWHQWLMFSWVIMTCSDFPGVYKLKSCSSGWTSWESSEINQKWSDRSGWPSECCYGNMERPGSWHASA